MAMRAHLAALTASALLCVGLGATDVGAAERAVVSTYETVKAMRVEGRLGIAPDGSVDSLAIDTPLTPEVRTALELRVREWKFEPVVVAGKAVPAQALMTVELVARERVGSGEFTIRIEDAFFQDPAEAEARKRDGWSVDNASARIRLDGTVPPLYPRQLMNLGIEGKVIVGVRIGADGKVAEASVVQSMLVNARGRDRSVAAALRQLEQSALAGARQWRFVVEPRGELKPDDMTGTVPFWYVMQDGMVKGENSGAWELQVRSPRRSLPWLPVERARSAMGLAGPADGGFHQFDQPIRLRQAVAGTLL